ncbi:hypothetical protein GQ53DRAFT_801165 [Thozetella sp. PMI_491]|nr:hypothetical protein GQ53DRAFT_801165 [Thozetella sp. PMI_491]
MREWGSRNGYNLRLGLHWANRQPMIFPVQSDQVPVTIWIHNDNQQGITPYGHYSGMAKCIDEDGDRGRTTPPAQQPVHGMDEQWELHRDVIKALYLSQNMTLKEVMNHMSTVYKFRASKARYERYLKKWNMTKNKKGEDLNIIARKVNTRTRAGKSSVVRFHGSAIDADKLRRIVSHYGYVSAVQRATRDYISKARE